MESRHVLAAVFSMEVKGEKANPTTLAARLGLRVEEARSEVEGLTRLGSLRSSDGNLGLTPKGRRSIRVVFIGGGFEVIHYGHVYTIDKAKSLGDVLVVSVARDSTIRRRKKRQPLVGEQDRVKLLSALRNVDAAILGAEGDIYVTLQKVAPDVVALGYDQYHMEEEVKERAAEKGLKVEVVRLDSPYPNIKTSKLLKDF